MTDSKMHYTLILEILENSNVVSSYPNILISQVKFYSKSNLVIISEALEKIIPTAKALQNNYPDLVKEQLKKLEDILALPGIYNIFISYMRNRR